MRIEEQVKALLNPQPDLRSTITQNQAVALFSGLMVFAGHRRWNRQERRNFVRSTHYRNDRRLPGVYHLGRVTVSFR